MSDYLKDTTPLGRSVEEIEETTQNQTHSPTPGEEREEDGGVPLALPATTAAGLGAGSGALVGAVAVTEDEPEDRDA